MEIKDYPLNKTSEREKKVDKVVKKPVKIKKKNFFSKLFTSFVPDDVQDIKSYFINDVLIPATKGIISDTVEKVLFGGSGRRSSSYYGSSAYGRVSYRNYYDSPQKKTEEKRTGGYSYDECVVATRSEAEDVLSGMDDLMERYHIVSVADLNDLLGIVGQYTDENYGWKEGELKDACIEKVRDGYLLRLPKARPLDR